MVEVQGVLEAHRRASRAQRTLADDHDAVVGHDLDAGRDEVGEERLAADVDLAADGVDLEPDLDALPHLRGERVAEGRADVAGLVAVDQQVDVIARGADVLEHPREVAPPVEERFDRRSRWPGRSPSRGPVDGRPAGSPGGRHGHGRHPP